MNRQVGPSILLSVFIVCFFAVALFPHDPPAPAQKKSGTDDVPSLARNNRLTLDASADSPGVLPASRAATSARPAPEFVPLPVARAVPASRHQIGGRDAKKLVGHDATASHSGRAADPNSDRDSRKPSPALPEVVAVQPRSAFTIVEPHESLDDVARRIYGTSGVADSIWRANRDALPRRDSVLAAGTVLRTPVLE